MQAVDAGVGGGDWLLSGLELVQVDESLYRTQNGRFIVARRGVWWLVAEHERALAVPITRVRSLRDAESALQRYTRGGAMPALEHAEPAGRPRRLPGELPGAGERGAPTPLVRLRTGRGLTQRQLGDLVGVSQAHISLVERGLAPLTPQLADRLAGALESDVGSLREPSPN